MRHLKPYEQHTNKDIKYLVVDIGEVLDEIQHLDQLQIFFNKFPIRDVVSLLLGIKQERDYSTILYDEMEARLEDLIDVIDLCVIDIFIENLIVSIDSCIYSKLPSYIDPGQFIFSNWISDNVIMLIKTE